MASIHLTHMRSALSMAQHALNTNETPVGCILVHPVHGIVSTGQNATNETYNGTMHAEFIAINSLLSSSPCTLPKAQDGAEIPLGTSLQGLDLPERLKVLKQCSLYVTVEPCIMCASLLRQFGIADVYFGAGNEKFGGTGGVLDIQSSNGLFTESDREIKRTGKREVVGGDYGVSGGWLREEAILMLRRFYVQENGRAPEPRAKKERVLKLEVKPLGGKDKMSASTEKLVVEEVLSERPNGVETTIMSREKLRAGRKQSGGKQGVDKGLQVKKARQLKDVTDSGINGRLERQQDESLKDVD
ncbi:tRNA-specific adenosine deaminase subunit [Lachnellula hyalina]|uniref:tRNA-specific adenosine deaminase subunit n=1 Tax=Lachnellula hyalina TaxID=1316788 RepID=A0A8H8R872_9HELO|nr:tRNA-specific adenosine deaminase subunit [Lachnellula hyalina]TVY28594.1 tRNA-specific adenosine deaminase subunit [Lachnellula hyalina]